MSPASWTVIVPVKDTRHGKSRLRLPAAHRRSIALAMAIDTVTAVTALVPVFAVVETEADRAALAAVRGVTAVCTAVRGLNAAILDGLRAGIRRDAPVAVLPADLPGLNPVDLQIALTAAGLHRFAAVPDRQGTGTTLLAAMRPTDLHPRYGPDSFARHKAAGAVGIDLPVGSTLRSDVDVPDDLRGRVGPHTRGALAESLYYSTAAPE